MTVMMMMVVNEQFPVMMLMMTLIMMIDNDSDDDGYRVVSSRGKLFAKLFARQKLHLWQPVRSEILPNPSRIPS